jgi:hypothetical protein
MKKVIVFRLAFLMFFGLLGIYSCNKETTLESKDIQNFSDVFLLDGTKKVVLTYSFDLKNNKPVEIPETEDNKLIKLYRAQNPNLATLANNEGRPFEVFKNQEELFKFTKAQPTLKGACPIDWSKQPVSRFFYDCNLQGNLGLYKPNEWWSIDNLGAIGFNDHLSSFSVTNERNNAQYNVAFWQDEQNFGSNPTGSGPSINWSLDMCTKYYKVDCLKSSIRSFSVFWWTVNLGNWNDQVTAIKCNPY